MKKATLIVVALAALFLSNCKKNTTTDAGTPVQDEKAALADEASSPKTLLMLQNVKSLGNQDLKRLAYQLLSTHEKYFVWIDNMKTATKYNTAQQALITELTNYITPELLGSKPTDAVNAFRDQWLAKAKLVFSFDQIRAIAYQLYPDKDHVVVNDANLTTNTFGGGVDDGGSLPNCQCYTGYYYSYSCGWSQVCPVDKYHGDCQNPTTNGCGFAWTSPCDNVCYLPGSDPSTQSAQ